MIKYKAIPGFYLYDVSDIGMVRDAGSEKYIRPWQGDDGYFYVSLENDQGVMEDVMVHKLVVDAFLDAPSGYRIRHLDHCKFNNVVENLACYMPMTVSVQCVQTGETFESIRAAARAMDIGEQAVRYSIKGRRIRAPYTFVEVERAGYLVA